MAGKVLVIPAGAGSIPRGKFAMLKQALISAGIWEAVTEAAERAPELWNTLVGSMAESGVKPDDLKRLNDQDARRLMLVELARAGIPLDQSAGLSSEEYRKYQGLVREYGTKFSSKHDESQLERPTTDDPKVAEYEFHRAMGRVANRLGLSGASRFRQMYEIAQVMNSLREKDIESAELFELNFPNALRG